VISLGNAEREATKRSIEILNAAIRGWFHAVYEQVGEFLCRHDRCPPGYHRGNVTPRTVVKFSEHFMTVRYAKKISKS
jgi:hypothetical protein